MYFSNIPPRICKCSVLLGVTSFLNSYFLFLLYSEKEVYEPTCLLITLTLKKTPALKGQRESKRTVLLYAGTEYNGIPKKDKWSNLKQNFLCLSPGSIIFINCVNLGKRL